MLDSIVDLVAKAMDALGFNGTRLRWKWNQRRQQMAERGLKATMQVRAAKGRHKMCRSCRALMPRGATVCPECGESMAGVRAPGIGRAISNILPGATMTSSLILLANGFWFILSLMAIIRETGGGGFGTLLFFPAEGNLVLARFGALYSGFFVGPGDWWRLIPPIFLHGGLLHFFFNCYVFLQLAPMVEEEYGTERFFVAYIVSGVTGFILSVGSALVLGGVRFTVGASGAVLGLMGLLIAYGLRRRGSVGEAIKKNMIRYVIFIFAITLLMGGRVDQMAHIGGLAGGFLMGWIMPWGPFRSRKQAAYWQLLAVICLLACLYAFFRVAIMGPITG